MFLDIPLLRSGGMSGGLPINMSSLWDEAELRTKPLLVGYPSCQL